MESGDICFKFELEFCLKKESYIKAYNEDGYLWDIYHKIQIEYFHELFRTDKGQQIIIENIKVMNYCYFKSRKTFLNGFEKKEFSDEEYNFLRYFIMRVRLIGKTKSWDSIFKEFKKTIFSI